MVIPVTLGKENVKIMYTCGAKQFMGQDIYKIFVQPKFNAWGCRKFWTLLSLNSDWLICHCLRTHEWPLTLVTTGTLPFKWKENLLLIWNIFIFIYEYTNEILKKFSGVLVDEKVLRPASKRAPLSLPYELQSLMDTSEKEESPK